MARLRTRIVEFVIEADAEGEDHDEVVVRPKPDGAVEVRWGCQSPLFRAADVPVLITAIDALKPHSDVWLKLPDRELFVRLDDDGTLYAGTGPSDDRACEWRPLRKALRKAVKA